MVHPHFKAISKMSASEFIGIIEESKLNYVRDNLNIHLHESQVKLLKLQPLKYKTKKQNYKKENVNGRKQQF